jgi:iron(III) transport system ATP-binding protein
MCALGNLAVADGGAEGDVEVMIRPEQIRLTRLGRETGGPTFHGVRAEVLGHTYYGPDKVVDLRLEDGSVVRARTLDPDVPGRGEAVGLVVFGEVVAFPASGPSRAGVVAVVPSGLEAC